MALLRGWASAALAAAFVLSGSASAPKKVPAPAVEACGSCHPLPPATGAHAKHAHERVACAECHGPGYRDGRTDPVLHQNGTTDVSASAGRDASGRSCAHACHGTETWNRDRDHVGKGVHHRDRDHDRKHDDHRDRDHDDHHEDAD